MKVGIDLGTTNSALAWIDPAEAEDTSFPPIHIFDIPQLVAPDRVEPRRTLPSFLFLEEGQPVGTYAREQGAMVPTRLVHSAKSWLSNPDVDRTAKILPWDAGEGRARAFAGRGLGAVPRARSARHGTSVGHWAARRAGRRAHGPRFVRRRGPRVDREGGAKRPESRG